MGKRKKRKINNSKPDIREKKASDDYDFENAVRPDNSDLRVPAAKSSEPKGDRVLKSMGRQALKGEYNFINVVAILLVILILGMSFALLRYSEIYEENDNKLSKKTFVNGEFVSKLSEDYNENLPGKELILALNKGLVYGYGLAAYNTDNDFIGDNKGRLVGIETYDEAVRVTAHTSTGPTTTTINTGKTTNTTIKINDEDIFVGPGYLTTTTKTKKKKTKTTTRTTTSTTTAFTGTTWSFRGTTTASTTSQPTTASSSQTTVQTTSSGSVSEDE